MKTKKFYFLLLSTVIIVLAAFKPLINSSPHGFTKGNPEIKSISALSFGKNGILFIGDSKSASIFAVETKDEKLNENASAIDISDIGQKIADAVGTQKENITITDMAVNPNSKKLYVAIQNSDGTPAILKLANGKIESMSLEGVNFSSVALNDVYAEDAKDARGRPMRVSTISDMKFDNGNILVSGLSNKEFSSTFRRIPFPFTDKQEQASLEIYHASHGRYETASPIRTFTTGIINGKNYLIASYTCTPLVLFPLDELVSGKHVKGRTVAEMGSGNTPIDMTTITKAGQSFLVMANTARAVTAVNYQTIATFEGSLTEKVSNTAGTTFELVPSLTKVLQIDNLDAKRVVILQKKENGTMDLLTTNNDAL